MTRSKSIEELLKDRQSTTKISTQKLYINPPQNLQSTQGPFTLKPINPLNHMNSLSTRQRRTETSATLGRSFGTLTGTRSRQKTFDPLSSSSNVLLYSVCLHRVEGLHLPSILTNPSSSTTTSSTSNNPSSKELDGKGFFRF